MNQVSRAGIKRILLIGFLVCVGCQKTNTPISLSNLDPAQDQQFIADQYLRQATLMKQKADDLKLKAERYAQLFGPDSEWATSAKLLQKFYEKEAKDRERLAIQHTELAKSRPHPVNLENR